MRIKRRIATRFSLWLSLLLFAEVAHGAGVTVITHGWQGNGARGWPIPWVETMARAIEKRAEVKGGRASVWEYNPGMQRFERVRGASPIFPDSNGEHVLIFNWAADSNQPGGGFAEAAGEALFVALMRGGKLGEGTIVNFVEFPLHFVGHSRGNVELVPMLRGVNSDGVSVSSEPVDSRSVLADCSGKWRL